MSTLDQTRRPADALIVAALATGSSYSEAAEHADVSRSTVARRMRDPEFRGLVEQERGLVIERTRSLLADAAPAAAGTLIGLADTANSETVRLGAARSVVELALSRRPGLNWVDGNDFARFVEALIDATIDYVPPESRTAWLVQVGEIGERGW